MMWDTNTNRILCQFHGNFELFVWAFCEFYSSAREQYFCTGSKPEVSSNLLIIYYCLVKGYWFCWHILRFQFHPSSVAHVPDFLIQVTISSVVCWLMGLLWHMRMCIKWGCIKSHTWWWWIRANVVNILRLLFTVSRISIHCIWQTNEFSCSI